MIQGALYARQRSMARFGPGDPGRNDWPMEGTEYLGCCIVWLESGEPPGLPQTSGRARGRGLAKGVHHG
jgi:hypothetical protein